MLEGRPTSLRSLKVESSTSDTSAGCALTMTRVFSLGSLVITVIWRFRGSNDREASTPMNSLAHLFFEGDTASLDRGGGVAWALTLRHDCRPVVRN
jgi:hypothetical protein